MRSTSAKPLGRTPHMDGSTGPRRAANRRCNSAGNAADAFRQAFLAGLGGAPALQNYDESVETTLDALADHLETHVDVEGLLAQAAVV